MTELSVVVCTLNEEAAIGALIDEIGAALAGVDYEIVVVDDDSSDGTQAAVRQRAEHGAPVRLLVRRGRRGLSSAAIEGWNAAKGRLLAIMDGDGQHDPAVLKALYDAVSGEGSDLAVMSRYVGGFRSGLGKRRALMSRLATWATGVVLHSALTDPMSGMFVMRREFYEAAKPRLTGVGFKILIDVVASSPKPPRLKEIGASLRRRAGGESKLDLRVIFDLFGLLTEKMTGGAVPARFLPFVLVGFTGVFVHAVVLAGSVRGLHVPFVGAQAVAILAAMTWNYWLNNNLTFRDRRRRGVAFFVGALIFYVSCLGGAAISELTSWALNNVGVHWLLAGVLGALLSGVWNFVAASRTTWSDPRKGAASAGSVEEIRLTPAQPQSAASL